MQSRIHHYEVISKYGKEPVASFINWSDAVYFAKFLDIRCVFK